MIATDTGGQALSRLGLGTYHLTSDRRVPHANARDLIQFAQRAGINVFDTAPLYGLGEAELLLGKYLDGRGAFLIDKIGRFERSILARLGDEPYRSSDLMLLQLEHSMRLLGIDRLPLLLIHEADWSEWWPNGVGNTAPVVDFVQAVKRSGLVGAVGVSCRKPHESLTLVNTGLFDAILFVHYYNFAYADVGEQVIAAAHGAGMITLVGAPYRQGLLTNDDPGFIDEITAQRRSSVPPGVVERIRRAQTIAAEAGVGLMELGLRWVLQDRRVDTVLVGARNERELDENLAWMERGDLPRDVKDSVDKLSAIAVGSW